MERKNSQIFHQKSAKHLLSNMGAPPMVRFSIRKERSDCLYWNPLWPFYHIKPTYRCAKYQNPSFLYGQRRRIAIHLQLSVWYDTYTNSNTNTSTFNTVKLQDYKILQHCLIYQATYGHSMAYGHSPSMAYGHTQRKSGHTLTIFSQFQPQWFQTTENCKYDLKKYQNETIYHPRDQETTSLR